MLIALEGIDGSGKGTHSKILCERFSKNGLRAKLFSFPNYAGTFFGKEVGKYLNGDFGDLSSVPIEYASILYAGDRFEMKTEIMECFNRGEIVVCDRYTPSNLAHQAGKVNGDRKKYLVNWIEKLEYSVFGMPMPDAVVWLDMPIDHAIKFVAKKESRSYTDETHDLHEASESYLKSVRSAYEELAVARSWVRVECLDSFTGFPKSIETISEEVFVGVNRLVESKYGVTVL